MSNQAAIGPIATLEIIKSGLTGEPALTAMNVAIAALRFPRHDWTPCAEGMPENNALNKDGSPKLYRVTVVDNNGLPVPMVYQCDATYQWDAWITESSYEFEDWETVIAWFELPDPYNPDRKEDADHIVDANKKIDQFREPTEKMLTEPAVHDEKATPAKWCCGKPPIARYHESEIGLSRACHTIKCQVCHSGVQVDIENDTDEAYDAAFKHAVELWNEKVQHRPPMNTEICLPRTEEAE